MDMSSYDEILLGFQSEEGGIALTIIQYIFGKPMISVGKRLLFATSGEVDSGNTVKELQPSAPDAVIIEGSLLNRGTKQEISDWVKSL